MATVFVYGSLMSERVMSAASGADATATEAHLPGYKRSALRGECFPGIVATPGAVVEGRLYCNLSAAALMRLDHFEGPWYQRTPVNVICAKRGDIAAEAYVVRPEHRHRLTDTQWNFQHFMAWDEQRFLALISARRC